MSDELLVTRIGVSVWRRPAARTPGCDALIIPRGERGFFLRRPSCLKTPPVVPFDESRCRRDASCPLPVSWVREFPCQSHVDPVRCFLTRSVWAVAYPGPGGANSLSAAVFRVYRIAPCSGRAGDPVGGMCRAGVF